MLKVEYLLKISRMSDAYMPISGPHFSTSTQPQARSNPSRVIRLDLLVEFDNEYRVKNELVDVYTGPAKKARVEAPQDSSAATTDPAELKKKR